MNVVDSSGWPEYMAVGNRWPIDRERMVMAIPGYSIADGNERTRINVGG